MKYGDDFQKFSKYKREAMPEKALAWDSKPPTYKRYPLELERVKLEQPDKTGGLPFYDLLQERRSRRDFKQTALLASTLSLLLWAAQGITRATEFYQFRTAPSAGGLYPVETYCVINRVKNLKPGVYHYEAPSHTLTLLKTGNFGQQLAEAALGQTMLRQASVVFVWSAVVERAKWKYDQRAYRYIYLDAGHIAQNTALAAVSCKLGSCQIGAFFDDEVNKIIGIDGDAETTIYMTAIGETN